MKTFKNNLDLYFNENKDLSNRPTKRYNYLIYDEIKHNNYITNGYSWVRLNNNNEKDRKKIEIVKEYGINKSQSVKDSIINFDTIELQKHYCNVFKKIKDIKSDEIIKEDNKRYIDINGVEFDYIKIKHIVKLIGPDFCIFTSEENNSMINITSKNGYAFLLGVKTY